MILRKSNNRVPMWVDPEFRNTFKSNASEHGCSIIEYSRKIAKNIKKDSNKIVERQNASFNFKI